MYSSISMVCFIVLFYTRCLYLGGMGKKNVLCDEESRFVYFVHFSALFALLVAVFLSIFVETTAEFQMTGVRIILEIILESYSLVTAESVGVSSPSWRFQFNRIAGAFHISHR